MEALERSAMSDNLVIFMENTWMWYELKLAYSNGIVCSLVLTIALLGEIRRSESRTGYIWVNHIGKVSCSNCRGCECIKSNRTITGAKEYIRCRWEGNILQVDGNRLHVHIVESGSGTKGQPVDLDQIIGIDVEVVCVGGVDTGTCACFIGSTKGKGRTFYLNLTK